ncbi:transmembrane protein 238-like [Anarrhichthys ocellatus]|uniref:transmembrane protein 238-like n=1 Tax=Anarrhichthys ocellatus TaxID=433405 RepID=UPI0012ED551A|nr:transmembrane protein 238-like [Anarrhichthys ocellatus]
MRCLLITACARCTLTTAGLAVSRRGSRFTVRQLHIWTTLCLRRTSAATMSTSVQIEPFTERGDGGVGRCKCSFWFAVAHDVVGVFIMMLGMFGGLVIHDLFIYAGAIIIFLSLIWWVFWYSGNIDVPPEELEDDVGLIKLKNRGLSRVVRRVSDSFTSRIRSSFRKSGRSIRGDPTGNSRPSNTEVSLSTIYDSTITSSSKELVRETLSI